MVQDLEFKNGLCHHRMLEQAHKKQSTHSLQPPSLHNTRAPFKTDPSTFPATASLSASGKGPQRRDLQLSKQIVGEIFLSRSVWCLQPWQSATKKPYQCAHETGGCRKSSHLRFGTHPVYSVQETQPELECLKASKSRKCQTINLSPCVMTDGKGDTVHKIQSEH